MARTGTQIISKEARGTAGAKYYTGTTKDATGDIIYAPERSYGPRGERPWYYQDRNGILLPEKWTKKFDDYFIINDLKVPEAQKGFQIDERLADIAFEGRKWLNALLEVSQDQKEYEATLKTIGTVATLINKLYGTIVTAGLAYLTKGEKEQLKNQIKNLKNTLAKLEREAAYLQIWKEKVASNQLNALLEENSRSANVETIPIWVYVTGVILIIWIIKRWKK